MKMTLVTACIVTVSSPVMAQIDGSATGWWTDAYGNNHYGSPPSSSGSSSFESSSSSGSSGGGYTYGPSILEQAFIDAQGSANDFQRRMKARQEQQRLERERKKMERQAALARKEVERSKQKSVSSPVTSSRPAFALSNLDRTGNDWKPVIFDLKPRAFASQIRSGDNYANRKQWDRAIRSYEAALRIDPEDKLAQQKLAAAQKAKASAPPKKGLFQR